MLTATYRLQLRGPQSSPDRSFGFAEAEEQVEYLAQLGVSHLYLSPIFTAVPDSNHNYDVIDPTSVNEELGGLEGLRSLALKAHEYGLKILVDIVPNHLGVDIPQINAWWWDVLHKGQDSEYERYFDIDWSEDNGAEGHLGLPILGSEQDTEVLEVDTSGDQPLLRYYDHSFPIAEGTLGGTPQEVHRRQHYRLMYWRDGVINYRRFFSVNGLAGIRQEDPVVFEHTHRILNQLLAEGVIDGLRVDHPDGLANPFRYLKKLRQVVGKNRWLLIEKILDVHEPLDPRLTVDGTTGYDALREFDGVFIHRPAVEELGRIAQKYTGQPWDAHNFHSTERELKKKVARDELAAEVRRLARAVRSDNWSTAGDSIPEETLTEALVELIAEMPVYRADYLSLSRVTSAALARLVREHPELADALDLIATALIADGEASTRFAQVCGAVMAKGVEDTAFYRGSRLVALQEVGGAPGRFGVSPAEFHMLQAERAKLWPRTMTTLSTHDTKRGEDVRARIICLSEVPQEFGALCESLEDIPSPDGGTTHFLLQNIIGVWPSDGVISDSLTARIHDYADKAMREANVHTSWVDPHEQFEKAVHEWIDALIEQKADVLTEFIALIDEGATTVSHGRKLLQLIAPGVPDIYQGTEFHRDDLVDPDNRRFIDYEPRHQALERVLRGAVEGADAEKIYITATALQVRKRFPECFVGGSYQPVMASGDKDRFLLGMARGDSEGLQVLGFACRRPIRLAREGGWGNTTIILPPGRWADQLATHSTVYEGTIAVSTLFQDRPQALLVRVQ